MNDKDKQLKSCPRCNSAVTIDYCEEDCCGAMPREVYCDCGISFILGGYPSADDYIKEWNNRTYIDTLENEIKRLKKIAFGIQE